MQARTLLSLLVAMVIAAGCSFLSVGGATFGGGFPEQEGVETTTVLLTDKTGEVVDMTVDPANEPPTPEGVSNHADGLVVTWIGGACDTSVEFVFEQVDAGYALTGTIVTTDEVCIMIGIERRILLKLQTPIPAEAVDFTIGDRSL